MSVREYAPNQIELATQIYANIERSNNNNIDAVLVSANSFATLRLAYPNYFADISNFISILKNIIYKS